MHQKIGVAAAGAAIALAAVAGCSATKAATKSATNIVLSPLAALQTALTTANNHNTVKVTGSTTTSGVTVQLNGSMQFSPLALSMSINSSGGATGALTMSEIYDGTNFYLQDSQLSMMDGGKPWAKFSLSSLGAAGSSLQSLLNAAKNETPTSSLEPLLASGDVKSLGTETVAGVQATHYSGTLTAAQVESLAPSQGLTAAQVQEIKTTMQQSGMTSETIDVWIGSNNLPVQEKAVVTTASGTADTTMQFTDWGAPVSITAPPADQVGDLDMPTTS